MLAYPILLTSKNGMVACTPQARQGSSPEKIVQSFPVLKLSQVYGVIAYYLENEKLIEDYVAEGEREFERAAVPLSQTNPDLFARLECARRQIGSKRT